MPYQSKRRIPTAAITLKKYFILCTIQGKSSKILISGRDLFLCFLLNPDAKQTILDPGKNSGTRLTTL